MKKLSENKKPLPLGIFAWFGYELPLTESLKHIKHAGFDQVGFISLSFRYWLRRCRNRL